MDKRERGLCPGLRWLLRWCATLVPVALSLSAAAQQVTVRYEIVTSVGPITDVFLYTRYEHPSQGPFNDYWALSLPAGGGTIVDPQAHDLSFEPRAALMLGVLEAGGSLPARGVLMMDATAADTIVANGWSFADAFGTWSGATGSFVGDLRLAAALPYPERNDATNALNQFASENARFGRAGNSWLELATVRPGETTVSGFKLVAFSTGEIVGEGRAFVTAVPEPGAWILMLVGVGMVAGRARRRA
jgi:hypothetical protein